ncbi:MAG TPA: transketolase [Caulobacteraceae bacterium]|nr:transketolase [Caulobacteraceae bacterium]
MSVSERAPRQAGTADESALDLLAIDTIRTLAIDAVEKADSGHAGAPMAMAPVGYTLWKRFLRYDPDDPAWPGRDRFVLSAGHGCLLLYALLHLAGVKRLDKAGKLTDQPAVSLDDIKSFRQLGSVCPGHPEHGHTTGVETTTGPLGQGAGNSVGMAIAGRWLGARYNRPGADLFDYNVYALCSDGDMMEGVASEAASIAGHLKLANLCWIWDDNTVTIEGHTSLAFDENVAARFRAYGWATLKVEDANDCEALAAAFETFLATSDQPTFIQVKSIIGYGSPHKQGTSKIHSDALGEEEVKLTKEAYGWPPEAQFLVPDEIRNRLGAAMRARVQPIAKRWRAARGDYARAHGDLAKELETMAAGKLPDGWDAEPPSFEPDEKGIATREASGKALNAIAGKVPWLIGGAADLAPSTKTLIAGADDLEPGDPGGRNMHFGVREHAMGAIASGMALCGLRPYTASFLIFSDYMRPPMRLAALMKLPVAYVFTHDSIGLGQDGPTHQPIEQLAALRAIPGMQVIRPADANETRVAWEAVIKRTEGPTCLVLSRQAVPTLDRQPGRFAPAKGLLNGGYILAGEETPDVILIASGAEVHLIVQAYEKLKTEGVKVRAVSLPSFEVFEAQDLAYRNEVLPPEVTARVTVEAAAPLGWDRYAGPTGEIIAMRSFGASAPAKDLMKHFGFTVEAVIAAAWRQLGSERQ